MMSRPGRRIFPDPDEPIVVGVYTCNECGKEYPALGNVNPTSPRVQVDGFMLLNNPCPFCGGQASTVSYPPGSYGSTAEGCGADDYPDTTHTLRGEGFDASEDGTGRGTPIVPVGIDGGEVGHALRANASHSGDKGDGGMNTTVVLTLGHTTSKANYSNPKPGEPCHPFAIGLDEEQNAVEDGFGCLKARKEAGGFEGSVMTPTMAVRRLTPRECERLQGFPDDHTRISEKTADGTRYKALGNSMAVPVMRWIGERIQQVEAQTA
jgi:DNA (cytosine-5)-methyltransferase 1